MDGGHRGERPGAARRVVLAATLLSWAGVAAILLTGSVSAQGTASVQIRTTEGEQRRVALSPTALGAPDVLNEDYEMSRGGDVNVLSGWSLDRVVRRADIGRYGYIDIGGVYFSRNQVRDWPGDQPPVIYENDDGDAQLIRPIMYEGDNNFRDSRAGAPLKGQAQDGPVIEAEIRVSEENPKPGEEVTFNARVTRQGAGQELRFNWTFGDGERANTQRATHTFEKRGDFNVGLLVSARGQDDEFATNSELAIGKPQQDRDDGSGSGGGSGSGSGSGSGGYGGYGGSGSYDYGGSGSYEYGGSYDSGYDYDYTRPGGGSDYDPQSFGGGRSKQAPVPEYDYEGGEEGTLDAFGVPVEGQLIDAEATQPFDESGGGGELEQTSAQTAFQPPEEAGFTVPGVIVGILATLGIFGAGALVELEKLTPAALFRRRPRRFPARGRGLSGVGTRMRGLFGKLDWRKR
jgi:uncharacterized membrane protein YgcG